MVLSYKSPSQSYDNSLSVTDGRQTNLSINLSIFMKLLKFISFLFAVLLILPAHAENDDSNEFSIMQELSNRGWHDMEDESWNMYGQITYISYWHGSFNAPYTNLNGSNSSLEPKQDYGYTGTGDLYFGLKTWWKGGEIYAAPETIAEAPFSNL